MKNKHIQAVLKSTKKQAFDLSSIKINKTPFLIISAIAALSLLYAFATPSADTIQKHRKMQLEIPSSPLLNFTAQTPENEIEWQEIVIKKGQTLSSIFGDLNLSQTLLYNIVHINKDAKLLTRIFPGAILSFVLNDDGSFSQLKYNISESQELFIKQIENTLSSEIVIHQTETQVQTANGTITGSLFNAGKKAGLTDAMVMKLASIFAWDVDFVLDIRQGDNFSLIYEKIYQDGDFIRDGRIIAASFTNQGDTYKAISFDDGNGWSYYNPEGRNMKKAFLRAPLNFSYISSNFNPKRFHPVQKRIKAHRGIDYAAPRGTPVFAAGDGVVTRASYGKYNGNHVFIKHPSGIVTKYLHFSKRKVKKGQRVKQGQTIGTVGSTGMVTGAHLHYEFVLNGVHRNPRTVKLPKASPLAKSKIKTYLSYATPLLSQLDSINVNKVAIQKPKTDKTES
ncbi:MAG: peptidoglycan DD-metalloendopeptidase family protein [Alcanivoracaceae bacterium]|nr:peptidoglycan DD-metalloendopeptidase family protein [Alcanivoracaceae bacterium]